jgi:hypothetical protein
MRVLSETITERGPFGVHNPWYSYRLQQVELEGGEGAGAEYHGLVVGRIAQIVAIGEEDETYMVAQQRPNARPPGAQDIPVVTSFPGGFPNPDETMEQAAKRELSEETGLTAEEWAYVGTLVPAPGISNEETHLYLALGLKPSKHPAGRDRTESSMVVVTGQFDILYEMLLRGEDPYTKKAPVCTQTLAAMAMVASRR